MKKPNPEDRSTMRRGTHARRKANIATKFNGGQFFASIPMMGSRKPAGLRQPDQLVLPLDDFRKPQMGFMAKARNFLSAAANVFKPHSARSA